MNNFIIDNYDVEEEEYKIKNLGDTLIITEYISNRIEGELDDNNPPPVPIRKNKQIDFDVSYLKGDLYQIYLHQIKSNSNYRWMEKYLKDAISIYYQIKTIIHTDPTYIHMKPYIDKSMTIYSVISLIVSISTLNPIPIMMALYKISN